MNTIKQLVETIKEGIQEKKRSRYRNRRPQ